MCRNKLSYIFFMNKAQMVMLNTEVKGSFVLLYRLKPRRGVPVEESHMFPVAL